MEVNEILQLMKKRELVDAFKALVPLIDDNEAAQVLFLELVRTDWNMFLLADNQEVMETLEDGAAADHPWLSYGYARYHDAVMPKTESLEIATKYYDAAMNFGIADADVFEAMCWRDGEYGIINERRYVQMVQEALKKGSHRAAMQVSIDQMYGNSGYTADPQGIYDHMSEYTRQCDEADQHYDPHYLCLVGQACEELGRKKEAMQWYDRALEEGDPKACYNLALLRGCDEDGNIVDYDKFSAVMTRGRELYVPTANMEITLAMTEEIFQEASEEDQREYTSAIKDELELAADMGERTADYILAVYYRDGLFGFEQDYNEAFKWAARGAIIRDNSCYGILADMVKDGIAPEGYDEAFQHDCELKALRYGSKEYMVPVVEAYKHGFLTDYAAEIEQYYLPQIEEEDE